MLSRNENRLSDARIATAFWRALNEAAAYVGSTTPNPPVGCVLLDRAGDIVAVGAHRKAGEAHAERAAIEAARAAGRVDDIDTVLVTLEPCNHHGRTPPCVDAILSTPARNVVIGIGDPNPTVQGGGAARLVAAGLDVRFLDAFDSAEMSAVALASKRLIAPFAKRSVSGLPWVTVKQAVDEKGSMVPPAGQTTFTSPQSLTLAHRLRRRADAILTGSGTILADHPSFTVRHVGDFADKQRFLAILDRRRRVPDAYRMEASERGFSLIEAASPEEALHLLGAAGALEVLVEAGPSLTDAVLGGGLWDEYVRIEKDGLGAGIDAVRIAYRNTDFEDLNEAAWPLGDSK